MSRQNVMKIDNKPLVLDMIEWIAKEPRTLGQVMDVWRTSCPRLSVWEDSLSYGLVTWVGSGGGSTIVTLTPAGEALLAAERPERHALRALRR